MRERKSGMNRGYIRATINRNCPGEKKGAVVE